MRRQAKKYEGISNAQSFSPITSIQQVGAQGRTRSVNAGIQDSGKVQLVPSDAGEKSKPMNNKGQPKLLILQHLPLRLTPELELSKQST